MGWVFLAAADGVPVDVVECPECGALVPDGSLPLHVEWHGK